jgi:hypothetical protein
MTSSDADLGIECAAKDGGWVCHVTVTQRGSRTEHDVSISEAEMVRYGVPNASVVTLVSEAFEFLLAREPKESILPAFAVSDIERFFPEFGSARDDLERTT